MSTTSTTMRVPSLSLLRAFLKPNPTPCTQVRFKTMWMPREKYANVTRLDKLHRKQKAALKQERLDSEARAAQMQPPSFLSSPTLAAASPSSPPSIIPSPTDSSTQLLPETEIPQTRPSLPYNISRTSTRSRSLPVYESTKSGGSLHITTIRRCSGDLAALQSHLLSALEMEPSFLNKDGKKRHNVKINHITKHIIVRGWRGPEVKRWCEMVGF